VLLGEALAAVAAGLALLRRWREGAGHVLTVAVLSCYVAASAGISYEEGYEHLTGWHGLLSLAVVGAFVAAVALEEGALLWTGVLGALLWLGAIAELVGSSSGWTAAVMLFGAGMVGISLLVARLHSYSPRA
jgi:hypothetical protein